MTKSALITGITGQDGTYLAELLIGKGYDVHGLVRGQNNPKLATISQLIPAVNFIEGDLHDQSSLMAAIEECQPDEVYNLGAISYVALSFKQAINTGEITALGVTRLLEAIRVVNPKIRFYQASSSEMFGKVRETPQTELTPFHPRSPYGVAKAYGHYITVNYRESYGMFNCSGILFNHESPRRGHEFVSRKISQAVARIKLGVQEVLTLGNIDSQRDWGFAGDYVNAMYLMLQQDAPDDYVVASGQTHSVRDFCERAFGHVDLDWEKYTRTDATVSPRPAEVDLLIGNAAKAKTVLGWTPTVNFEQLVTMMVDADLAAEQALLNHGSTSATPARV